MRHAYRIHLSQVIYEPDRRRKEEWVRDRKLDDFNRFQLSPLVKTIIFLVLSIGLWAILGGAIGAIWSWISQ
jgi:hypothetical protein